LTPVLDRLVIARIVRRYQSEWSILFDATHGVGAVPGLGRPTVGSLSSQHGLHHGKVVVHLEKREASAIPPFWLNAA
jgi:hypothetical protein